MTVIDPSDLPLVLSEPYSVIENVLIDGEGAGDDCQFGIYVHADHCIVRNVAVRNMPRLGIGVRGANNSLIERAHVEQTVMQGIWVDNASDGIKVNQCHVTRSGKDNIQIAGTNGSVTNCKVEGAGNGLPNYAGIYVAANSRRMSVEGNTCIGNGTGIDMSWGYEQGELRNGGDASCGNVIHGNRCHQNNSCGIACASNGTIISENQCLDNGVLPVIIPSSGIGIVNANNCIVTENVMANNGLPWQKVGLMFLINGASTNASRNCIITSNIFSGNEFPISQWFSRHLSPLPINRGHILASNIL